MATAAAVQDEPATRFAKDQLKAIIERIERLEEEKKAISDDIRDVYAEAKLLFDQNITALIATACDRRLDNTLLIRGSKGEITLTDPWAASRTGPPDCRMTLSLDGKNDEQQIRYRYNSFTYEIAAFMSALQNRQSSLDFPALSPADSVKNLKIMENWRKLSC